MDQGGMLFETYADWLAWWLGHPVSRDVHHLCIDARGRVCTGSSAFVRARDENAFPVRMTVSTDVDHILSEARRCLQQAREHIAALETACGLAAGTAEMIDAVEARVERMAGDCTARMGRTTAEPVAEPVAEDA